MVLEVAADFLAQSLVDVGVKNVFGGHGGALVPLVNAVVNHPDLTWVCTRNEANASLMAAADSKLTGAGRMGACIATSGPGASNLLTGLLDAQLDRVPVIAITGAKPRSDSLHSEFQDIDQARIFAAGGLAYSVTVSDPLQLVALMRDAVAIALTQRVCVHVAVPVDIQGMQIQAPEHLCSAMGIRRRLELSQIHTGILDDVAAHVSKPDERVVIALGLDARDVGNTVLELAEVLGAPVVTRLDAKGAVDESHPLAMGVVGVHGKPGLEDAAAVIAESTLVLALGVGDLSVLLCDAYGLQVRPMIEVAMDSYGLSTRFRAVQSLIAHPSLFCQELIERLTIETTSPTSRTTRRVTRVPPPTATGTAVRPPNITSIPAKGMATGSELKPPAGAPKGSSLWDSAIKPGVWKEPWARHRQHTKRAPPRKGCCQPDELLRMLSDHVREQDVVCIDTGDITLWASSCLCLRHGTTTLSSERLGTMGYGLCAGIAASLQRGPSSKAIVIVGDGGFQMTMNELGTAMQHKANLLIIIMDNGVLGRVEFGFKDAKGCTISGCDWVALAKSYGADGAHVRSNADIERALSRGMNFTGLFVVAAYIDHEHKADMAKTSDSIHPAWLATPQKTVDCA